MYIYQEEEIRETDRRADANGLSVAILMENSGRGLYEKIRRLIRPRDPVLILAGRGNNGGDGIVLARYLNRDGYRADLVFPLGLPKAETANRHFQYYRSLGYPYFTEIPKETYYSCIIDSLLGIGVQLPLKGDLKKIIEWANQVPALRIAVDLPTGVAADHGQTDFAFQADYTFALHGIKPSAFLLPSARYYGKVEAVDIGLTHTSRWKVWTREDVRRSFNRRDPFSHKGTFGTGLLLAGSDDMPGSCLLAALGAMRSGIGKLIIGTTKAVSTAICSRVPEATFWFDGLQKCINGQLPEGIRACAIGPGIGSPDLVELAVQQLLGTRLPLVLDAGALRKRKYPRREAPTILTPHPGEFSRMTGRSVEEIQANRIKYARDYAVNQGVIVVLKGPYTVIAYPDGSGVLNPTGNAGLAKGGSGDTLTGMILALICTEENIKSAVANAVFLHGACADRLLEKKDSRSMVASEISDEIGRVLKEILS